ncbi:MAG: UDP-2,4-diacetamido-2,4,6-trideoxy-beta-L-altropyranose hydrolase [Lachnospiraceae bacterium]|nr:UDP-2,4-diacetamido-2,4,6-trideoxy-beta-L-altropyranose hydrolase [Lachnospiraceae bacterium]
MSAVYFRTDGNEKIATGHIMRCLSIARACRSLSMKVCFLVSDEKSVSLLEERFILPNEFSIICLHSDYQDLDGELPALRSILKDVPQNAYWLFIDSYFVTKTYLSELQKICHVAYLDDLLAFDYPADLIINYDVMKEPACYHKADRKLTGAAYTPLRDQFQDVSYKVKPEVQNVLLSAGGTDACNVIGTLLHKIFTAVDSHTTDGHAASSNNSTSFLRDLNYHVITSRLNSHFQELEHLSSLYPTIHIHTNVQDMAALMCQCDLGISAGGTTLYELCAVGVPSVSFITADNQLSAVKTFSDDQIIPFAGNACSSLEKTCDTLITFLSSHKDSYAERKKSSQRMRAFLDGKGSYRIASALADL